MRTIWRPINPSRVPVTVYIYRQNLRVNLSDWANRPLDGISRKDVEGRFNYLTEKRGWSSANQTISMLRSIYRRPCVDHDKLRNPVELWLAGGGKFHRKRRRRISAPSEVLPRWRAGIEAVRMPAAVLHGAMMILMTQAEAGVTCPMSMTYASMASLRSNTEIADTWGPRLTAQAYDPRFIPAAEKDGVTIGMAMTEKQGGSDVRSNTTRAERTGGGAYVLTGHKWFCSAPMSDAFLTLACAEGGLTCCLVPRWRPDGERNRIHIMRLKDKMGDRSNASAEIEYDGAWAQRVGDEGRGVPTIIEMVQLTRYDCVLGSAGGMRAALTRALWHTAHRHAFRKALIDHSAMRAVLADLILESEAATALALRIGFALDRAASNDRESDFVRLATPVAKFWICKRQPGFVYEALECHGGAGYVEEGPMPRLFRQSPLNAIWEGSGNVIALDILRAAAREPDSVAAVVAELELPAGRNAHYDAHLAGIKHFFSEGTLREGGARGFAQKLGLGLQAAALHWAAPATVFEAFCDQRLDPARRGFLYGDVCETLDQAWLIERAYGSLGN